MTLYYDTMSLTVLNNTVHHLFSPHYSHLFYPEYYRLTMPQNPPPSSSPDFFSIPREPPPARIMLQSPPPPNSPDFFSIPPVLPMLQNPPPSSSPDFFSIPRAFPPAEILGVFGAFFCGNPRHSRCPSTSRECRGRPGDAVDLRLLSSICGFYCQVLDFGVIT
jgi:hypothetical protein